MTIYNKIISLSLIIGIGIANGLSDTKERSLEDDVRWFIQATDTSSNQELRKKILSNQDNLKPILEKIAGERIQSIENHFFELELLATLSWGMDDKNYGKEFTRRIILLFKDWPFKTAPIFFEDYLEYDPDGAEETFQELVATGNEIVKPYAREYLKKSRKRIQSKEANPPKPVPQESDRTVTPSSSADGTKSASKIVFWGGALAILLILFLSLLFRQNDSVPRD